MVTLKRVPHSPDYFAGYFNYRGAIVPVIDLCVLIQGAPSRPRLSTRIILVDYRRRKKIHVLGLIAERVTETIKKRPEDFIPAGIRSKTAPYLGGIMMEQDEMIQYIELDRLPDCIAFLTDAEAADSEEEDWEAEDPEAEDSEAEYAPDGPDGDPSQGSPREPSARFDPSRSDPSRSDRDRSDHGRSDRERSDPRDFEHGDFEHGHFDRNRPAPDGAAPQVPAGEDSDGDGPGAD